jgi:hypothetical protein
MIISHQHRFVFAAIPKTGTHSVRHALREHMSAEDLEQVGLFVNKRFPFEELAKIRHGHISLQQVNPFDRFVSYCAFMTRENGAFDRDPKDVMRRMLFELRPMHHVLFQPQHTFVTDDEGRVLADYVGRVEEMQASYDHVCARIGIPSTQLGQVNSSKRGQYRDYYDQRLIDGVAELYATDLKLFGYGF